jgi:hypothetical protein
MPIAMDQNARDIRYRYTTFTAGFYTHPFSFGCFTPGASIGFLSRLGYFERDMGLPSAGDGLDTDLGVRGTLEGAFKVAPAVELLAEGGIDYALDRWRMGSGYTVYRGEHTTPWLQAAVRVRPY